MTVTDLFKTLSALRLRGDFELRPGEDELTWFYSTTIGEGEEPRDVLRPAIWEDGQAIQDALPPEWEWCDSDHDNDSAWATIRRKAI